MNLIMICFTSKFNKIVTSLFLFCFALNLFVEVGILAGAEKDSHSPIVSKVESKIIASEINETDNQNKQNCSDPCHEGICHFGHCSFTPASIFFVYMERASLKHNPGRDLAYPTPLIFGLKRPPRIS